MSENKALSVLPNIERLILISVGIAIGVLSFRACSDDKPVSKVEVQHDTTLVYIEPDTVFVSYPVIKERVIEVPVSNDALANSYIEELTHKLHNSYVRIDSLEGVHVTSFVENPMYKLKLEFDMKKALNDPNKSFSGTQVEIRRVDSTITNVVTDCEDSTFDIIQKTGFWILAGIGILIAAISL